MPAIKFGDIESNLSPVPMWRFLLTMPDLPGFAKEAQTIQFLAQRVVGGTWGIDYEQAPYNSGLRNFPVGRHIDAITVQVVENQKLSFWRYIIAWQLLIIDKKGNYGLPKDYKKPITMDAMDEGGNTIARFGWKDCSPQKPDQLEWDGAHSSYMANSCSFMVDSPLDLTAESGGAFKSNEAGTIPTSNVG
jgi:hypothetical protein